MPRTKADRTVIHRIELGGKERELAESALAAFQFNRVASPIVAGMSDVSFMVTLGAILTIWFPDIVIPAGATSIDEVTTAIDTGIRAGYDRTREERLANRAASQNPDSTLDDATGPLDFLGRLYYNLTNPNWGIGDPNAPGFRDAWRDAFD